MRMLQSVGLTNYVLVGDEMWFCDVYHSNLLKMQLSTGKISLEKTLLTKNICDKMQYGPIFYLKNKIVLAPRNASDVLIYDIHTRELTRIALDKKIHNTKKPLFISGFIYGEEVFFVPGNYPAVIKVNIDRMSIEYFDEFYKDITRESIVCNSILCNSNSLLIDNFCLFAIYGSNILVKVYLDFSGYEIIRIQGRNSYRILSMLYSDGEIWLAGLEGLFAYSGNNNSLVCFNEVLGEKRLLNGIGQVIRNNNKLLIIPINGEKILLFDKDKHECFEFQEYEMSLSACNSNKYVLTGSNIICLGKINDDELCIFSTFDNEICVIDIKNNLTHHYAGELDEKELKKLLEVYLTQNLLVHENDVTLNEYIELISK